MMFSKTRNGQNRIIAEMLKNCQSNNLAGFGRMGPPKKIFKKLLVELNGFEWMANPGENRKTICIPVFPEGKNYKIRIMSALFLEEKGGQVRLLFRRSFFCNDFLPSNIN